MSCMSAMPGICATSGLAAAMASPARMERRMLQDTRQTRTGVMPTVASARIHLEQTRRAHPAADAHRHHADATALLPETVHELRRELRARRAKRMTERYRAAMHVDNTLIHPELLDHRDDLRGERLVELDHLDVIQRQARALERLGHRA